MAVFWNDLSPWQQREHTNLYSRRCCSTCKHLEHQKCLDRGLGMYLNDQDHQMILSTCPCITYWHITCCVNHNIRTEWRPVWVVNLLVLLTCQADPCMIPSVLPHVCSRHFFWTSGIYKSLFHRTSSICQQRTPSEKQRRHCLNPIPLEMDGAKKYHTQANGKDVWCKIKMYWLTNKIILKWTISN